MSKRDWFNLGSRTAVIKESLRVYSSNSPPMERVVPPSGMTANGHHIPEGTIVSVPQFVAHRDVEVYGKDALDFRPERWLEADEASLKKMEHNFLAVSHLKAYHQYFSKTDSVWKG